MRRFMLAGVLCATAVSAHATTIPVTFTQLTGVTGGSPAATAVFVADLSSIGLGQISSVTIQDNSGGLGGSPGQFSGFDLDAIVLSSTLISNATQVGTLPRTGIFDFGTSVFVPGAQRPPTDPALFGTSGGHVDNVVATLDAFDGNSTTAIPGAAGFVSLGDGGMLSENLTTPVTTGGPLFLYIGEVGNNGEVAASSITVSSERVVPEPASIAVLSIGLGGLGWLRRRRRA
jgi:PEP-CTERM motif